MNIRNKGLELTVIPSRMIIYSKILNGVSVQIKILSEKIAVEAKGYAKWRLPLLIFHRG
jgi:hypothetical protein